MNLWSNKTLVPRPFFKMCYMVIECKEFYLQKLLYTSNGGI